MGGAPAAPIEMVGQSRDGDGAQPSRPLVVLGKPGSAFGGMNCHMAWKSVWLWEPAGCNSACHGPAPHPTLVRSLEMHSRKRTEPVGLVLPLMVTLGKSLDLPKIPPSAKSG